MDSKPAPQPAWFTDAYLDAFRAELSAISGNPPKYRPEDIWWVRPTAETDMPKQK